MKAFAGALLDIVPRSLKKIVLMDNGIPDSGLEEMFKALANTKKGGIEAITIMQNEMDSKMFEALTNVFLKSKNCRFLRKLHFKLPHPPNRNILDVRPLFKRLVQNHYVRIQKLTLSQFKIDNNCVEQLGDTVKQLSNLTYLDISGNRLDAKDLKEFLEIIHRKNFLKWLNISFN